MFVVVVCCCCLLVLSLVAVGAVVRCLLSVVCYLVLLNGVM